MTFVYIHTNTHTYPQTTTDLRTLWLINLTEQHALASVDDDDDKVREARAMARQLVDPAGGGWAARLDMSGPLADWQAEAQIILVDYGSSHISTEAVQVSLLVEQVARSPVMAQMFLTWLKHSRQVRPKVTTCCQLL